MVKPEVFLWLPGPLQFDTIPYEIIENLFKAKQGFPWLTI